MSSKCPASPRWIRSALGLGTGLSTLAIAFSASAQRDIAPPLPNVLLLVDTSGSMEYKTDGSTVTCNPANTALTNDKSRWVNVIEVLSGTINGYSCESMDRVSSTFKTGEYQLVAGTPPYDWRYPIPYHRPLSGGATGCAPGKGQLPGVSPANPFLWPTTNAVNYHRYSDTSLACGMSLAGDGILDSFGSRVRFGLMTFDTEVDPNRGYAPAGGDYTSANADTPGGQAGLWSYVVGSQAVGRPVGCTTPSVPQEVGARNGAAPVWEGRMVNFGNPNDADTATRQTLTNHVKEVLLATRPFGATPIAGMLRDAEDFFWNDPSNDPTSVAAGAVDPFDDYGPRFDPYLQCTTPRQQAIILLTDGEPNMDLRPFCSDPGSPAGQCPFDLPETIANRLANPVSATRKPVKTYVVGFALEQVDHDSNPATAAVSCNSLVTPAPPTAPLLPPAAPRTVLAACNNPPASNAPLQACCTLWKIAIAGMGDAYFASNASDLRGAVSNILSRSVPTTSRTQPAISGGGAANGGAGYRFLSGFEVGQLSPWRGHLERHRIVCVPGATPTSPKVPQEEYSPSTKADDFAANVNNANPATRRFFTVVGKTSAGVVVAGGETVRKSIGSTDPDGAGIVAPEAHAGLAPFYSSDVPPAAMAIPVANYPSGVTTAAQARTFFLEWLLGLNALSDRNHRCKNPSSGDCSLFGDIYHSTPQIVGAPTALIRDESYEAFAIQNKLRPIMLYTSTNDGFLHAFKVTSNDPADASNPAALAEQPGQNNELWSFAPPAVLPSLHALYPYNHMNLLDGVATIRDVVATASGSSAPPVLFERNAADARGGVGTWRTILVQGFGADRGGYFALDVTNPVPDPGNPTDTDRGGPRFLWQLTRDNAGKELFGKGGGTPTITTLFFDPSGGTNPREIPVAVLPGGRGGTLTGAPSTPVRTFPGVTLDPRFTPRGQVNGYTWGSGNVEIGARSLTIVRLDTGEIVRTFRQTTAEVNATLQSRVTVADLDSPIIGQAVPFPGDVGTVADRLIIGDQDGRLWKVNVASRNPANWTMKLFFDLYPSSISAATAHDFDDGQPIAVPPVISIDRNGEMTVAAATGDQDALGYAPNQTNYVYSLIEDTDTSHTTVVNRVNWLKSFANGERIVGPLALFGSNVYFATFLAASGTNVCSIGTSKLWGMNYIQPFSTSDFKQGGAGGLNNPTPTPSTPFVQMIDYGDTVVSGVSIAQQPSCYSSAVDAIGDDRVGFGGMARISQVGTSKFQLVMHQNQSGTGSNQAIANSVQDLPTPPASSRIASWATLIE